jgi:hypothetical protein
MASATTPGPLSTGVSKMKIKFLTGFRPAGQSDAIPTYEAGKEYDFRGPVAEGYARKYIGRGLAEEAKPTQVFVAGSREPVELAPAVVEAKPIDEKVEPPVVAKPFAFRGNKRK